MKQRARKAEDKEARRQSILSAAEALFESGTFPQVKMLDVAQKTGLAKGTLFLYFPTKEALFMELLEQLLRGWLDDVDEALANNRGRWSTSRVTRIFTDTICARLTLTRLLTLRTSVLEHNVEAEQIHKYKMFLNQRLVHTGAQIELRLPGLSPGEGIRLLQRIYAVVIGLRLTTDPGPSAPGPPREPCLNDPRPDFSTELEICVSALLQATEKR